MSEFFEYISDLAFDIEAGRLRAADARLKLIRDWGGVTVRGYVPKNDPQQRAEIERKIEDGIAERTARRHVRGR